MNTFRPSPVVANQSLAGTLDNTMAAESSTPPSYSPSKKKAYDPKRRSVLMQMLADGEDPGFVKFNHVMHGYDEEEVDDAIETFKRISNPGAPSKPPEEDPLVDSWAKAIINKQATLQQAQEAGLDANQLIAKMSAAGTPEDTENEKKDEELATQVLSLTDSILQNDKHKGISGFIGGSTGTLPGTDARQTAAEFDQLKGMLALDKRQMLKGQGQISDFEFKVLEQAASSMNRSTSEDDFKKALLKVRGVFKTSLGEAARVKVISPDGETARGELKREEIDDAIRQGYAVEYF